MESRMSTAAPNKGVVSNSGHQGEGGQLNRSDLEGGKERGPIRTLNGRLIRDVFSPLSKPLAAITAAIQPIDHSGIRLIDADGHKFGAAAIRMMDAHQTIAPPPQVGARERALGVQPYPGRIPQKLRATVTGGQFLIGESSGIRLNLRHARSPGDGALGPRLRVPGEALLAVSRDESRQFILFTL
jgi:hypothetical protein